MAVALNLVLRLTDGMTPALGFRHKALLDFVVPQRERMAVAGPRLDSTKTTAVLSIDDYYLDYMHYAYGR